MTLLRAHFMTELCDVLPRGESLIDAKWFEAAKGIPALDNFSGQAIVEASAAQVERAVAVALSAADAGPPTRNVRAGELPTWRRDQLTVDAAMKAASHLRFGSMHINEASSARADVIPFGGVEHSGFGREGPDHTLREITEERLLTINP